VDLVGELQQAALEGSRLYHQDENDHPSEEGHLTIARILGPHLLAYMTAPASHPFLFQDFYGPIRVCILRNGKTYRFDSEKIFLKTGWTKEDILPAPPPEMDIIPYGGKVQAGSGGFGP